MHHCPTHPAPMTIGRRTLLTVAASLWPGDIRAALANERIFSPRSPWNVGIPRGCSYSGPGPVGVLPVGIDALQDSGDWTVPCHLAVAADPLQPLLYNPGAWSRVASGEWRRNGNRAAVEREILASSSERFPFPGNVFSSVSASRWQLPASFNATRNPRTGPARFHVGSLMIPAGGSDGHMVVAQPDGRMLETYATIRLGSGTVVALSYSVTNPMGLGDGWENGQTASMLPAYAGLISGTEISSEITHAIAVTLPPRLLAVGYRYPAYAFDRDAMTARHSYAGLVPMGGRLVLPSSVETGALRLATREGAVIAAAAKRFGFIVVDRGGEGITLRMRPDAASRLRMPGTWMFALQSDLRRILAQVKQVSPPCSGDGPVNSGAGTHDGR